MDKKFHFLLLAICISLQLFSQTRIITNFNRDWKFFLGNDSLSINKNYDDSKWRTLDLPHDWSIEGNFGKENPTTFNEGALPAGIGWYRKTFTVAVSSKSKRVYINFDGVYKNSEVWINGFFLGKRPNGYISFRYELTDHLHFGNEKNTMTVKVDNSAQPDSRWYSGSGIYRKVWLLAINKIAIDQWGTFVTTPKVNSKSATINIRSTIIATGANQHVNIQTSIINSAGKIVSTKIINNILLNESLTNISTELVVSNPILWSVENSYLYKQEKPFCIRLIMYQMSYTLLINSTFGK